MDMVTRVTDRTSDSYPAAWNEVADIRVFKAAPNEWTRLISWRTDMLRKGWKLLRVSTKENQMIAVFGRTREELMR